MKDDESVVRDRQSLRFKDKATGVDVTLVGTMHYNPVSIDLASSTVSKLKDADALHAVVLESCPCLLYTSPSPRDVEESRMPSSA